MARKQRNEVDYFPHSVNHGKKMFYLRDKFNNDGYAVWFMLLEQLGKSEYHYLDLKDEIQLMYLSSEFKVSETILNDIIEILVKFGEFDKELWNEESILFNEKFIDNISDAYKKRSNDCISKKSLLLLLISKGRLKPSKSNPKPLIDDLKGGGNTQRIVKESKVEEIIEYDSETAHEFLKNNCQITFESWEMKNKKSIKDYDDFINFFNNKVDLEEIEFTSKKLIARLNNLHRNWIKNQSEKKQTNGNEQKTGAVFYIEEAEEYLARTNSNRTRN